MGSDASTTLVQSYTAGLDGVLADIVLSAFLFGFLTVLSSLSTCYMIRRRGFRHLSVIIMLGTTFVLYVSTATYFGAMVAYAMRYNRFLNNAASALSSTSSAPAQSGLDTKLECWIISVTLGINVAIGDAIVWWRVCALWRKKWVIALGAVLIVATVGTGIVAVILRSGQTVDNGQLLLLYDSTYGPLCGIFSLIMNGLATSLIAWKTWQHRRVLRLGPIASNGRWSTPTMKVLVLLTESGMLYSVVLAIVAAHNVLADAQIIHTASAKFLSLTAPFLYGCFVPIVAIYPTIIISIVALNWSPIEGSMVQSTSRTTPGRTMVNTLTNTVVFRRTDSTRSVGVTMDPLRTADSAQSSSGLDRQSGDFLGRCVDEERGEK